MQYFFIRLYVHAFYLYQNNLFLKKCSKTFHEYE